MFTLSGHPASLAIFKVFNLICDSDLDVDWYVGFWFVFQEQSFELDWLHGGTVFPNISVDQERASFQFLPRIYVALFRLSPADGTDVW